MARHNSIPREEGKKYCSRCKENRPLEEFGAMPSSPDGFDPYCRTHRKEARDKSRQKPKPKHIQAMDLLERKDVLTNIEDVILPSWRMAIFKVVGYYVEQQGYPRIAEALDAIYGDGKRKEEQGD